MSKVLIFKNNKQKPPHYEVVNYLDNQSLNALGRLDF